MSAYGDGLVVSVVESPADESFFKFSNVIAPHEGLYQYTDAPLIVTIDGDSGNEKVQIGTYSIFPINLPPNAQTFTLKSYACKIDINNYANFPVGPATDAAPVPQPYLTAGGIVITNAKDYDFTVNAYTSYFTVKKDSEIPNLTHVKIFFLVFGY